MRRLGFVLAAALLFVTGVAAAQPVQLTNNQMDKVAAGHFEIDVSNVSITMIDLWFRTSLDVTTGNRIVCPACYLNITSPTLSIASKFGPP
jgi:hypothetical protein